MDFEPAEPASTRHSLNTRRGLLGAAGLVGAAAALLGSASPTAAAPADEAPLRPTDNDVEGLTAALRLEQAAAALYDLSAAELSGDAQEVAALMSRQHRAYSESISGAIGLSLGTPNQELVDEFSDAFTTSDAQAFGAVARTLENTAIATHTSLMESYEGTQAIALTASIIAVEARHSTVLTSLAGFASNLDEMLGGAA